MRRVEFPDHAKSSFQRRPFKEASQNKNGWAAPQAGTHAATQPVTDGPVSSWQKAMTLNGTISASAVLLLILLASAAFGWNAATGPTTVLENGQQVDTYQFPALGFVGIVIGFIAVIFAMRKPALAKFLGPVYAIGYGFAVGAISKGYETFYNGIVLQAVLATASVFGVMLVLYRTRIIKVTDKFRRSGDLRHARRDGAVPRVVHLQPVRRVAAVPQRRQHGDEHRLLGVRRAASRR